MAHAKLSPSAAKRWMACPGSLRLCAGIPYQSSTYADEGSVAHAVAEAVLREASGTAAAYVGRYGLAGKNGVKIVTADKAKGFSQAHRITQEMAAAVQIYIDHVRSLPGDTRVIEAKVSAEAYAPGVYGTADAIIVDPFETLYVCDYKHGAGVPVYPEENPQAMIYALGALAEYDMECENVEIIIVQPRADEERPIKSWRISTEDLRKWGQNELAEAVARTMKPDAPVCAGEHCRFCPAQPKCPAIAQEALAVAQQEFSPVAIPAKISLPSPELMTDDQISKMLHFAENILSPWIKEVTGYVQNRMEQGYKLPDWKLVRKRSIRKWADEEQVVARLGVKLQGKIYDMKVKSPAQMEKVLKDHGLDTKAIEPLLDQTPAGLTIAHVSDKRPAVEVLPATAEFFDDL